MVEFKLNIGDPKSRKTYKKDVSGPDAEKLVGLKIGDSFHGELLGLTGYELRITGGSDKSGFPMRVDVAGQGRKKIILTKGVGFYTTRRGKKERKTICGSTISEDIVQINCTIIKHGKQELVAALGLKPKGEEKAEEKMEELPKEPKKEEVPKEKPKEEAKPEIEKPAEAPKEEKKEKAKEAKPAKEKAEKKEEKPKSEGKEKKA